MEVRKKVKEMVEALEISGVIEVRAEMVVEMEEAEMASEMEEAEMV